MSDNAGYKKPLKPFTADGGFLMSDAYDPVLPAHQSDNTVASKNYPAIADNAGLLKHSTQTSVRLYFLS